VAGTCSTGPQFGPGPIGPSPCGCSSFAVSKSASAQVRVRPRIDGIDPPRGLIGTTVDVNITGRGFGNSPANVSVQVGGTGVTVMVDQVTDTEILVSFSIADNAGTGNHSVIVRVGARQSNSVNFFVQVPARLRRDSMSALMNEQGGCGAFRQISYQLLDQSGQPINIDGTLQEIFSNFTSSDPAINPPQPTQPSMGAGQALDVVGYSIPSCPPPFSASLTQTFRVVIGQKSYPLSTSNSISMGRTSSGARFVDVTMTNP
jgi:hypothetical protein